MFKALNIFNEFKKHLSEYKKRLNLIHYTDYLNYELDASYQGALNLEPYYQWIAHKEFNVNNYFFEIYILFKIVEYKETEVINTYYSTSIYFFERFILSDYDIEYIEFNKFLTDILMQTEADLMEGDVIIDGSEMFFDGDSDIIVTIDKVLLNINDKTIKSNFFIPLKYESNISH